MAEPPEHMGRMELIREVYRLQAALTEADSTLHWWWAMPDHDEQYVEDARITIRKALKPLREIATISKQTDSKA